MWIERFRIRPVSHCKEGCPSWPAASVRWALPKEKPLS